MSREAFREEELVARARERLEKVYDEALARLHEEKTMVSKWVEDRVKELRREMLESLRPS